MCGKEAARTVLGYNPICDRIITLRIQAKPANLSMVQVYAPTAEADEKDHEEFYGKLQDTIAGIPKGDIIIVMGDIDAKVEEPTSNYMGKYGLGKRNDAGERLIEFCESNELRITNTWLPQPKRRLYTWTSPGGKYRNQIDYILINKRWASSIKSCKTLPGADCGSDHQLLTAQIKVKLKKMKNQNIPAR